MKYLLIPALTTFLSLTVYAQSYEDYIEKSYEYLEKEEFAAAEESIRSAMRLEPGNPHNYALLTNLGTIQQMQGKYEEAILSYTAALSRNQTNVSILESRASLYAQLGETEKAIHDYSAILLNEPAHQDALYNRGVLYLQQRNLLAAEADFDKIIEVNDKTINGRLGHAILEKMRGNYSESERIYNYLIKESPRYWFLYESRADLYFQMGKNGRAMSDINKLFTETEPSAALYVLRGKVKLAQYEKPSAIKDFTTAKEMGYDTVVIDELMKLAK
ncbi:MAG: tetratricopeptide repeat protein [Tannerellaceae bacterium]|nr:tetratricopeptide repeat protein [Tannerellaceae bacterium]